MKNNELEELKEICKRTGCKSFAAARRIRSTENSMKEVFSIENVRLAIPETPWSEIDPNDQPVPTAEHMNRLDAGYWSSFGHKGPFGEECQRQIEQLVQDDKRFQIAQDDGPESACYVDPNDQIDQKPLQFDPNTIEEDIWVPIRPDPNIEQPVHKDLANVRPAKSAKAVQVTKHHTKKKDSNSLVISGDKDSDCPDCHDEAYPAEE